MFWLRNYKKTIFNYALLSGGRVWVAVWVYDNTILNKSENATPEMFAIYIQSYGNQECKWKCILMFK